MKSSKDIENVHPDEEQNQDVNAMIAGDAPDGQPSSSEEHHKRGRHRRSIMRSQKRAIIILGVCILLLIGGLITAKYFASIYTFEDLDGKEYKVMKKGGEYALCDQDGYKLETTNDGYYITELGTLVEVDKEKGTSSIYAVVDTDDGEFLGTSQRILMFKHISQDDTQQVEVHNQYGSFIFYRDSSDAFQIKGFENTPYSPTLFSSLVVSAGYPLSMQKIENPIKDANGNYSEYGLVPETRVDADGNSYEYTPIWYRITDTDGNAFTVYVGNAIPSGAGFYVKYTNRDAVYIMNYSVDASIINMYNPEGNIESVDCIFDLPIEYLATPTVCYPMSMTTYFNVQNFMLFDGHKLMKELGKIDVEGEDIEHLDVMPIVAFSYWDLDVRTGTFNANDAYKLLYPKGYYPNDSAVDIALQSFCYLNCNRVVKLGVTDADLAAYHLDDPGYAITFEFYPEGGDTAVDHFILISDLTEDGKYYLTSALYDMIVECDRSQLTFLENTLVDWVDPAYFQMNLAWATKITVEAGDLLYTFDLDNSLSDSVSNPTCSETAKKKGTITSDKMTIVATDNKGNKMQAISEITVVDKNGILWTIDDESISAKNAAGESVAISNAFYATNSLGEKVIVLEPGKGIACADGSVVGVTADKITITTEGGIQTTYLRYGMAMFRKFYQALLYASIEGDVHDGVNGISDEKIAEFCADPDKNFQAKITVDTCYEGTQYLYRFYPYSERRSMLTVNGALGEFSVLRSFTDKIVADAARVIAGELIDPTSKY